MTAGVRALQLHIARVVVEAAPGTDRLSLERALQQQLPAAIAQRLQSDGARSGLPLADRIADAVADRVAREAPG
ncbi:MAG: hypothetical protein OEU93_12935 [Rubrivivax sp.]|nr:hypothetical protein [Rubrivivax sp.]